MTEATRARGSVAFEAAHAVIVEAMERGCALGTGARLAGLSPGLVHRWLVNGDADPNGQFGAFARRIRQLQGQQIEAAERLHAEHRANNPAACQWYMSRIAPDTYGDDAAKAPPVADAADELPDASPDDVARVLGR